VALPALGAAIAANPIGAISAGGTLLGGIGSIIGASRRAPAASAAPLDYASLYSAALAPGQQALTTEAMVLAQMMAPYLGTEAMTSKVLGQTQYDQFKLAAEKEQTRAGLLAGIASQYASSAIGNEDLAAKAKTATEMLGIETAAALTKQYSQAAQNIQERTLMGETSLLNPTTQALANAGQSALQTKNQLAGGIAATNLDISKRQEDTRNAALLQRGQTEGQRVLQREKYEGQMALSEQAFQQAMAQRRFGAGMALAGQRAFG